MLGCLIFAAAAPGVADGQTSLGQAPAGQTAQGPATMQPVAKHHPNIPVVPSHHGRLRKPVHPAAPVVAAKPNVVPPPSKPAAPAKPVARTDIGAVTGLPIPRFVCLRSDDVNMRAGPGDRYPVLWQYKRRDLPVKIEREFDVWRLVEDMDGFKGWVNQALLTGHRTFVVTSTNPVTLRDAASDDGAAVAVLKPGVVGRILACDAHAEWCRVQADDYRGFLPRSVFWGTNQGEAVAP
jgi:SH3-like domain-containing protein